MEGFSLDCVELMQYQPNRYPFLMIDHVSQVIPGTIAIGFKNLTLNEWYFPIHFPGAPNMPGALQLEALAQMLTVAITTLPGLQGKVTHALSHTVRFRREVKPGRFYLLIEVEKEATQSIFYFLKEAKYSVFIDPTNDLLEKYLPTQPTKNG